MTDPGTMRFDARPLTDPVDPRAVTAFVREQRVRHPPTALAVVAWVILLVIAVIIVFAAATIVIGVASTIALGGNGGGMLLVPLVIFVVLVAGGGALALVAYRRRRVERYRIARFAAANGMAYEDRVADPPLPGMIFNRGSSRLSTSLVRGYQPRFVEFGNYQYTVKSGKNSTTYRWGYVAVKLDVPLPNIVLDAVGNNALGSNLPSSFSRDQRLSLEGDFDEYFHLYCPRGYEADALYLFTPDIMARFIDHAAQLDVEIVDDWLFLYTQRPVSTTDPATWEWLFSTVGALMTKLDQWARWRDDRLAPSAGQPAPTAAPGLPFATPAGVLTPPPGVAEPGRRLKGAAPWAAIIVIGILFLVFALPNVLAFFVGMGLR